MSSTNVSDQQQNRHSSEEPRAYRDIKRQLQSGPKPLDRLLVDSQSRMPIACEAVDSLSSGPDPDIVIIDDGDCGESPTFALAENA